MTMSPTTTAQVAPNEWSRPVPRWPFYAMAGCVFFHLCALAFATEEREEQFPAPSAPAWEFIVIPHSATRSGSARAFDHDHRSRGMANGLAYHFVIGNGRGGNDGEVEIGERWLKQIPGGHCRNERNNTRGIGICLVGDFSDSRPTAKQMEALVTLVTP